MFFFDEIIYTERTSSTVALGAAPAAPINVARKFNSHLPKLKRIFNFSDSDGHKKFGAVLTEMSTKLPVTTDDLGKLLVMGGRFGVTLEDLPDYVTNVAKASRVWGMEADELGEKMGNFMKVFSIGANDVPKYFDVITKMGRTSGKTSDDVLKSMVRAADGLANFKLSIPQVAALTTTIMSFGEGSEQAGTLVSGMLQKLSIAPRLGAAAQKTLRGIGLSAKVIPQMLDKNPQKVLDKLFEGLSKLSASQRGLALYSIFGRGPSKMVGKLIDNLGVYRENMEKASNATGIFEKDWDKVQKGTTSALTLLENNMSFFGQQIGLVLLPTVKKIAQTLSGLIQPVSTFMNKHKELTSTMVHSIAGFMSLRIATFALGYASMFLFGGLNRLVIVFKGLRLGLGLLGAGFRTLIFGRLGKLILITGALGSCFAYFKNGTVKDLGLGLGALGRRFVNLAAEAATKLIPTIKKLDGSFLNTGNRSATGLISVTKELGNTFWNVAGRASTGLMASIKRLGNCFRGFTTLEMVQLISNIGLLGGSFWLMATRIIPTVFSAIGSLGRAFWFFGTKTISVVFRSIGFIGRSFLFLATTVVPAVFSGVSFLARSFWFLAATVMPKIFSGVSSVGRSFWFLATTVIPTVFSAIGFLGKSFLRLSAGMIAHIMPTLTALTHGFRTLLFSGITKLLIAFPALGVAFRSFLMIGGPLALIGAAYLLISNWEKVKIFFSNIWDGAMGYWQSFKDAIGGVVDNFKMVVDMIWNRLEFNEESRHNFVRNRKRH